MDIFLQIAPIFIIFAIGAYARHIGFFVKEHADLFLKVVFYIALPSLVLVSVSSLPLTVQLVALPVAAGVLVASMMGLAYAANLFLRLPRPSFGAFVTGVSIMNVGFLVPFVIAVFGDMGLARLILFDVVGGLLTFTVVYYLSCKYAPDADTEKLAVVKKVLISPPLWATIIALGLNFTGTPLIPPFEGLFSTLGALVGPLVVLALGINFSPKITQLAPTITGVAIRMGVGLCIGLLLVQIFSLEGLERVILLLAASAPIGFNTMTFSSLNKLDRELASSLVSVSILGALIVIPVLLMLFG